MGWESSGVVGFNLGPLLQGQTRIAKPKSACNSLIIGLEVFSVTSTYRKSWDKNLFMWSGRPLAPPSRLSDG